MGWASGPRGPVLGTAAMGPWAPDTVPGLVPYLVPVLVTDLVFVSRGEGGSGPWGSRGVLCAAYNHV